MDWFITKEATYKTQLKYLHIEIEAVFVQTPAVSHPEWNARN